jgi:hypothetical protein
VVAGTSGAYNRTATRSSSFINNPYGLDNGSTLPFFNSITVYQMARHEYVSYTLHNPIIASWNHNPLEYEASQVAHDNLASIAYEAVSYGSGQVTAGTPEGFGVEHYDQTPSPLQGGPALQSASPSFVNNANVQGNAQAFLNNLTATVNGYQNSQSIGPATTAGQSIINNLTAQQTIGGVQGITFPVGQATNATVVATPVRFATP